MTAPDRNAPAGHSTDRLDVGFAAAFGALAAWSGVGLTLAETGLYHRSTLIALAVPTSLMLGWWSARAAGRPTLAPTAPGAVAWVVLWTTLAAGLTLPPGEHVIDGEDGSIYLNIGRALERQGALTFREPLVDRIDRAEWPAVFGTTDAHPRLLELFPGGVQLEPRANVVRPGFFHLFPVWVANVEMVFGPRAGYWVTPVFAVLAIAATWLLGRALASLLVANLGAALLSLNFAQIWFARMPSSEILAQFLVLSGLYFTAMRERRPTAAQGVLAGAAFGLAACTRIDVLVLVAPLVACYLALTARRFTGLAWGAMAAVFGLLIVQCVAHALLISGPYTRRIFWFLFGSNWGTWRDVAIAPVVMGVALLIFVVYRWRATRGVIVIARVMVAIVAAGTAVWLWNGLWTGPLSLLVTPLGVALAIAGAIGLARRRRPADLLLVGVLLASALVYVDSVRDFSPMPTLFRRFVPVILPLGLLCAATALGWIFTRAGRWRWATLIVPAALVVHGGRAVLPVVRADSMRGVHDQVAGIAEGLPDDAVVLVDGNTPSHLALSLRYTFGRDVLFVDPAASAAAVGAFAASMDGTGRPLVAVLGDDDDPASARGAFDGLVLSPTRAWTLDYVTIEPDRRRVPDTFRRQTRRLQLYDARPSSAVMLPVQIEIGEHDVGARRGGFYEAERMGAASARWTADRAAVALPQLAGRASTLVLRLAGPRPPDLAPPEVQVSIAGRPVGTTPPLGPEFRLVTLPIDEQTAEALASGRTVVSLRSPTFVPREHGFGDDGRTLGVAMDWLRLEPRTSPR